MLRFLHGYLEESWNGFVKRGLIDDTSGVKFHQIYDTPDDRRFNRLARKNGPLYEIVRECARPFYIDRLQGGWWFLDYAYDPFVADVAAVRPLTHVLEILRAFHPSDYMLSPI